MFGALLGLRLMTDLTAGRPEPPLGALNFSTGGFMYVEHLSRSVLGLLAGLMYMLV